MSKEFKENYDKITHKFENSWETISNDEETILYRFADEYKVFLDNGKTERECVDVILRIAKLNGFRDLKECIANDEEVKPGMKIYGNNKGKSAVILIVGEDNIQDGMNIIGTHLDSPRLDIKPFPLYEDGGLALLKTHYYGWVKKYQWASIPIALHGVVFKKNGEKVNLVIGENENDPVFFISDLLPHLAKNQMVKKLSEGITGEGLNIIVGSIPLGDKDIDTKVKFHIMKILNNKYGIEEDDFAVAEIQAVPATKARDVGLDRGLVAGYGHDDRACSFAALRAILEVDKPKRTCAVVFADKEEVGSNGNTGMESKFFENIIAELIALQNRNYNEIFLRRALARSKALSGDVMAAFNPNFPDVLDKRNAAFLGKGVTLVKYTGSRGKLNCNDANSEFIMNVRNIFNENNITWQIGELGKVDQGGAGTIAYALANYGAEVIDCGVPVINMHAPYELISKIDLYMTFKGYKAFLKDA